MSDGPGIVVGQQQPCSGYCFPLYIFGGIASLGILVNFLFDRRSSLAGRLFRIVKSTLWAALFGLLIFLLCRLCYRQQAYTILILPSLWFGINMLLLLLQNRAAESQVTPPPIVPK